MLIVLTVDHEIRTTQVVKTFADDNMELARTFMTSLVEKFRIYFIVKDQHYSDEKSKALLTTSRNGLKIFCDPCVCDFTWEIIKV